MKWLLFTTIVFLSSTTNRSRIEFPDFIGRKVLETYPSKVYQNFKKFDWVIAQTKRQNLLGIEISYVWAYHKKKLYKFKLRRKISQKTKKLIYKKKKLKISKRDYEKFQQLICQLDSIQFFEMQANDGGLIGNEERENEIFFVYPDDCLQIDYIVIHKNKVRNIRSSCINSLIKIFPRNTFIQRMSLANKAWERTWK